jgi:uncharacterized protein (TIGR02687 family)
MPELNLNQITNKLDALFSGESRRLVFWYDSGAEFEQELDTLGLENAGVLRLSPDNQLYIKHHLECVDTTGNYLIYAPFAKPGIRDNHLWDTIKYSAEFFADRASLLRVDLGIPESLKPVIQKHIKFFASKDRADKFYKYELGSHTRAGIEIAMMSVICKLKAPSFDEVARTVICEPTQLDELAKYELSDAFWAHCEQSFGYTADEPSVRKLTLTLFATCADRSVDAELPREWQPLISPKSGNVVVFLESMMNNVLYRDRFDMLAAEAEEELQADRALGALPVERITECDCFPCVDELLITWITERLLDENTAARLNDKTINELASDRKNYSHFGDKRIDAYNALIYADKLLSRAKYHCEGDFATILKQYQIDDYLVDASYRSFYYHFDKLSDHERFDSLRQLVENVYTNSYLNPQSVAWNDALTTLDLQSAAMQHRFYSRFVGSGGRSKAVIIISDALRYEVAAELAEKLRGNEYCAEVSLNSMLGVLPSVTKLGMAALLPHKTITISDDFGVAVDGMPCEDTKQREAVLKKADATGRCCRFDDIERLNYDDMFELFKGVGVFYIYHNRIDAMGDKEPTENKVFNACADAINEVYELVTKLARFKIASHYIVTADHGFIYKRDKLRESDKIVLKDGVLSQSRRYALANRESSADGVRSFKLGGFIGDNMDDRFVCTPLGSDVFKTSGGGSNYVHGGSSPQELLIPVLDIATKTGRQKKDIQPAGLALASILNKVTNLITAIEFIQSEPVGEMVRPAVYRIFFVDADGKPVSSEGLIAADRTDTDSAKRSFRVKLRFKDMSYDREANYYLVVYAGDNDVTPVIKQEVKIDMAFSDDFGFNL